MDVNMNSITIAIDGYSSTGKSTLARDLAKILGYRYIDSGAMYRAVTLYALRKGYIKSKGVDKVLLLANISQIDISFVLGENTNSIICLNGEMVESEIRGMEVSKWVSEVSAISEVRNLMVAKQQLLGKGGGFVMDGRDIGSVVFPNAELKLFMTAQENIRAKRRYDELLLKEKNVTLEEVRKNISERDYIDSNRAVAPLIQTEDAIVLDNTNFTQEQQLKWVLKKIKELNLSS